MKHLVCALVVLLWAIPCEARTITVDVNGAADFNTVQAAIDDANDENSPRTVAANLYVVDANGLVSWWEFDEGDGNTAYDSAGDNDGTIYGANWTDGLIGGALSFDAVDDYVGISAMTLSSNWSLSAWLRLSYDGGIVYNPIIGGSGPYRNYLICRHHVDDMALETNTEGDYVLVCSGVVNSSIGDWAHYAITRSGNTVSGYKNGLFVDEAALPVGGDNTITKIGAGYSANYYEGAIDDVRIYNRALTEGEILEVVRSGLTFPYIQVWPETLEFDANEGGSNPASRTISIHNIGVGVLDWRITEDCPWLEVEPNTGSSVGEPNEVTVSVDISGLAWGSYSCELTVSDPCALNSPRTVDVNLTVCGPLIELSSQQFEFSAIEGGPNPEGQILGISNGGGRRLNWEIAEDCNWLSAEPNNGSSTGEVNEVSVSLDISGLVCGDYSCELIISDANALNSPQTVQVTLRVLSDDVLLVPSLEYPTIQAAIDAACHGDTIIVEPGVYTGDGNREIDFIGKAITVRSTDPNDPNIVAATIIDCQGNSRGFYFHSGEDGNSVLDGITIANGYVNYLDEPPDAGGGICCGSSSPTISNCVITDCFAWFRGGAIYCYAGSNPMFINCKITNNSVEELGGGIASFHSSPTISSCVISGNFTHGSPPGNYYGGGIFCRAGDVTITDSTVSNNSAGHDGGGICCRFYNTYTIANCKIVGNSAQGNGGGIKFSSCNAAIISSCTIAGNSAGADGGGIDCVDCPASITNSIIAGNSSGGDGGGINSRVRNCTTTNCTFSGNSAQTGGAICYKANYTKHTMTNSILWGNSASLGLQIAVLAFNGYPTLTVAYSDLKGGQAATYAESGCTLKWGSGNIDVDPCFADPCNGDYHLQSTAGRWDPNVKQWVIDANTSRCIDAGNPGCGLGDEPNDANNLRINMGAYGGTAEASMPPYDWALLSDVTNDGITDFVDFGHLAGMYTEQDDELPADFDRDGDVDYADLELLAEDWLKETTWPH